MNADYEKVKAELAKGTDPALLRATCPWDRLCVSPPTMTPEDVERHLTEAERQDMASDPYMTKTPARLMLASMVYGGRDQMGMLCPVFALRLRGPDGRGVADSVRSLMRGRS